jgi:hypothetical protein
MNMNTNKKAKTAVATALLAVGTFVCMNVFADTTDATNTPDKPVDATVSVSGARLPATHQQGKVSYVSGGIGKEETKVMRRAEPRYPLTLEFAQYARPHDEYLADIKVNVTDKSGKLVLQTTSDGPILLTKLPSGHYKVSAENDKGQTITKQVVVDKAQPERVVLVWPKHAHTDTQNLAQVAHQPGGFGS